MKCSMSHMQRLVGNCCDTGVSLKHSAWLLALITVRSSATPIALEITPASPSIARGTSIELTATARYLDDTVEEVGATRGCRFSRLLARCCSYFFTRPSIKFTARVTSLSVQSSHSPFSGIALKPLIEFR